MSTNGTNSNNDTEQRAYENQFFGEPSFSVDYCELIVGLLRNYKIVITQKLDNALIAFAKVSMQEENWPEKRKKKTECEILEAKIEFLDDIERDVLNMFPPAFVPK